MTKQYIINVECVLKHADKILVVERSQKEQHAGGLLAFPGGKLEEQDGNQNALESCAKREVLEELGVHIRNLKYVHNSSFAIPKVGNVINLVMFSELSEKPTTQYDESEISAVHWMRPEEVISHSQTPPWLSHSIQQLKEQQLV